MRRVIALSAAAALTLGIAGAAGATAAEGGAARRSQLRTAVDRRRSAGAKCSDPTLQHYGAQCGFVVVPLDYNNPHGQKIELAVSRVEHTVPKSQYQGVMLVNPGGPGGSASDLVDPRPVRAESRGDAYDWIGFDPRGVGSSEPVLTCDRFYFHGDRPPYVPRTKQIMNRWVARIEAVRRRLPEQRTQRLVRAHRDR